MVAPYDDDSIEADDLIIRRIDPENHLVYDENLQTNRLSSQVFSPSSGGGMSVDIEKLITATGSMPEEYVVTPKWKGAVQFTAGAARDVELMVGLDPLDSNPCHGEVWGRFSRSQKRALMEASEWLVPLTGVEIDKRT
ncbi:hypothetical protein [Gimibacter soli]|uniref:Uncharacterized protein n=1 Tax=Gimibacter soli TaxID=3024400 RepID=A0AAF0BMD3_9PROT|nr:hypothetical protein [Gimibacter soli]WCL54405.1 hypothetical protein PH603_01360 [Gimibacter soli]